MRTDRAYGELTRVRSYVNTPDGPVLREVDTPSAAADQALVDVEAFSLNRGELALLAVRTDGWRPGQDVAGIVTEPAADGSGPTTGTRVVGLVEGAGWAEQVPVPTAALAQIPDDVPTTAAATLPIAGVTALRTVRLGGALLGRPVLVTGASGAVGRFQVELAAQSGAAVTAVARSEHTADLTGRGAAAVVETVEEAAGGFELVLEQIGGAVLAAALAKVAPGGTVVVIGATAGEPTPIGLGNFVDHENAPIQSYPSYAGEPVGPDLAVLLQLMTVDRLHAPVARTADWTELPAVLDELRQRRFSGKAVLTVR